MFSSYFVRLAWHGYKQEAHGFHKRFYKIAQNDKSLAVKRAIPNCREVLL